MALLAAVVATVVVVPAHAVSQDVVAASEDTVFMPKTITINVGDTVTFKHSAGDFAHNVDFDDGSYTMPAAPDANSWKNSRTFTQTGTFLYHCDMHGGPGGQGMSGKVVVVASGAPVPDTTKPVISALRPVTRSFGKNKPVKLSLTLSEAASVGGTITRRSASGIFRFYGFVSKHVAAGTDTLDITRTRSGRRLTPGAYDFRFTAADKAGNRSPVAVVRFTVRAT
jgi:plastocyanin